MSECAARQGIYTCVRDYGHAGIHVGEARETWHDDDAPTPDPRDAELARLREENARLRGIVRDVSERDPWARANEFDASEGIECAHCHVTARARHDEDFADERHAPTCPWLRAKAEAEGRR